MYANAVFLQYCPNLFFRPIPDGPVAVYKASIFQAFSQIGGVPFPYCISGTLGRFLTPFPGEYQCAAPLEPALIYDCGRANVDFQVGAAPSGSEAA